MAKFSITGVSPCDFGIFLVWLDTGDINASSSIQALRSEDNSRLTTMSIRWHQLLELNFVAERLDTVKFQSAVLNELVILSKMYAMEFTFSCILDLTKDVGAVFARAG